MVGGIAKKAIIFIAPAIILFQTTSGAFAQDWPGFPHSIHSEVLNENREIRVILPNDYETYSQGEYDVLYVLDGEWYMKLVPFVYQFAVGAGHVPLAIIVLIPNKYLDGENLRVRDFSIAPDQDNSNLSGADNFHSFLKNELIPLVDRSYRASDRRTLLGSSLSGMFSVWAFIKEPGLFQSYIASDPYLAHLSKMAAARTSSFPDLTASIFIGGIEQRFKERGIQSLDSIFEVQAPRGLNWKCVPYPNETHYSVQLKAFYDGFRFSYFDHGKE